MILSIVIKNFIIIEDLTIDFSKGFTAITGETGTGKSIILDAIDFCFKKNNQKTLLKDPEKDCEVSIEFSLDSYDPIEEALGIPLNKSLKITRTLSRSGKSVIKANNAVIQPKIAKDIAQMLFDITGQFDSLFDKSEHLAILDKFMLAIEPNIKTDIENIGVLHKDIQAIEKSISEIQVILQAQARDIEHFSDMIYDIEELGVAKDEETDLLSARASASKMNSLDGALKAAIETMSSVPITQKLSQTSRTLEKFEEQYINEIKNRIDSVSIELSDIEDSLFKIKNTLPSAENLIVEIDDRLALLRSCARKYNTSAAVLFEMLEMARAEVQKSSTLASELRSKQDLLKAKMDEYINISLAVSKKRAYYANELSSKICDRLVELLMPNATFRINIKYSDEKISASGKDDIELLANFNSKHDLMNFNEIASGGEAARLHFAIKTVIGLFSIADTIIFDEVDIGIGGAAAFAMGEAMRALSSKIQVISITHSPQVASRAISHIGVRKEVFNNMINVYALHLQEEERSDEIARMISGNIVTNDARQAAKQLLK